MIIVSDTSPISNLLQIGEIGILRAVFARVIIPPSVYSEICEVEESRQALANLDWIESREVAETGLQDQLKQTLDPGEAEAIALAIELSADSLLIDESLGRSVADQLGVRITGLLGVLLEAKDGGHISAVRPFIDRLVSEAGFRLGRELINDVLYQAGEI